MQKRKGDVDSRFLVNRGDCHRALGNSDLALSDYHRALDVKPEAWEVRLDCNVGTEREHAGDDINALALYAG